MLTAPEADDLLSRYADGHNSCMPHCPSCNASNDTAALCVCHQKHGGCRLRRYYQCGAVFGKLCCCIAVLNTMYLAVLNLLEPTDTIDVAPDLLADLCVQDCKTSYI